MGITEIEWRKPLAIGQADLGMAKRLGRMAEDGLDAGGLPVSHRKVLVGAVAPLQPMVDGGLVKRLHQAVLFGRAVRFFDQIPGLVEALGGEIFVGGGQIEIGGGWHGQSLRGSYPLIVSRIENRYTFLESVVEPLFVQMTREMEGTLLKIHKEEFGKRVRPGAALR